VNLLLFLSDRCNMACDYCFLDLNHGPAVVLELEAAKKAVDGHLRRFGARARFTVLGGEPFVHYSRLKAIVEHVRAMSLQAPVSVVTNGTLACPEMLSELRALGAGITVSIDGRAASHDRHRKLVGEPSASSLDETLRSLESCGKKDLRVNMVVCQDTVESLLSNVEHLRETGFAELSFHINVMEQWRESGLEILAKTLEGFGRYYRALEAVSPGSLKLSHLESFPETALEHEYDDLVLGADGRYYPCDGLFSRPYSELGRWAVGDADGGVDWKARSDWHRNAKEYIHSRLPRPGHYSCARETYFHCLAAGADADARVRAFHAADEIMGAAMAALSRREAHADRC
jgi:sulfatase maturation enzyme AslB (radical SAM superfamily)